MRETTLCYVFSGTRVLMLHRVKKHKDPNQGKWIGIGGGIEAGESPEEGMLREVYEECSLVLKAYRKRGVIDFRSDIYEDERMHLYTSDAYSGTISDCDEGELKWIEWADVMALQLWEGDRVFLRLLEKDAPYFELVLNYEGDKLVSALLDGKEQRI